MNNYLLENNNFDNNILAKEKLFLEWNGVGWGIRFELYNKILKSFTKGLLRFASNISSSSFRSFSSTGSVKAS